MAASSNNISTFCKPILICWSLNPFVTNQHLQQLLIDLCLAHPIKLGNLFWKTWVYNMTFTLLTYFGPAPFQLKENHTDKRQKQREKGERDRERGEGKRKRQREERKIRERINREKNKKQQWTYVTYMYIMYQCFAFPTHTMKSHNKKMKHETIECD